MRRDEPSGWSLSGFASAELPRTQRYIVEDEVLVHVLKDTDVFERFVDESYNSISLRWQARTQAALPFNPEEYRRYYYTALRTRVARVNNERFQVRCDDPWALNPVFAAVLAGIGLVVLETPSVTYRPVWDSAHDDKIMTKDEQANLTRRIRSLVDVDGMKFMPIFAISGDRTGVADVMQILPMRDALGRVTRLTSGTDFDPLAAVTFLIGGLSPELWDGQPLPTHPQLMPKFFLEKASLLSEIFYKMSEAGIGK